MKNIIIFTLCLLLLVSCVGSSSTGIFGSGVSIALDPRTLGTQIDDSLMQKNLAARIILLDKSSLIDVSTKVLDGRIFVTGKVDEPEEKLKITKMAWETTGVRSVKNDIQIREKFKFKVSVKDALITSQLKTALIFNKKIKSANYNIDTYKKKVYLYGIATDEDERGEVINEAKQIADVEQVVASIFLVSDLSRHKE
jgi:osmotically-inducible protein OsmY